MTNSKRKRNSRLVRVIPDSELGPNFYPNLKAGIITQFELTTGSLIKTMSSLHEILAKNSGTNQITQADEGLMHVQIDRNTLIEGMSIVDEFIGQVLHHYQVRILKRQIPDIRNYSKVEDGLKDCLSSKDFPKELDKLRARISHFRTLRNQYAHYRYGAFSFSAKHESFESFLGSLEGIELQKSEHCYIDGKAGVFLPYSISSGKYISTFFIESRDFLMKLLEFVFPTNKIEASKK